jgi:chromosome segregation ATPase
MQKLAPVEEAKTLFNEAKEWGVWKWLTEKSRARRTADAAWEALESCEKKVKSAWSDDLKKAYQEAVAEAELAVDGKARARHKLEKAQEEAKDVDAKIKLAAKQLKKAEDDADKLHWEAEATFDEADRRLSTSMAREGSQQAIDAWEARERVIRKAEALGKR